MIIPSQPKVFAPLGLLAARLGLVAAASVLTWLTFGMAGYAVPFPPNPLFATVALLPVNLASLALVRWLVHKEGRRLRDVLGFARSRLARDIGWGLLWLAVLYLPFALTVMAVMFALYGAEAFDRFETVFVDSASMPPLNQGVLIAIAIVAVLSFAPLNAPVEELVYRGYAQGSLARHWPASIAILISALAFGLQHAFFAPTAAAVVVYVCAFTVWGALSGVIVHLQRRLMPIVVAHVLVNVLMSAPALALPFLVGL